MELMHAKLSITIASGDQSDLGNSLIRGLTASLLFWVGSAHRLRL